MPPDICLGYFLSPRNPLSTPKNHIAKSWSNDILK